MGVLASQNIEQLIKDKALIGSPEILPAQLQPASLDLRLGTVAYRVRASFLAGEGNTVADRLAEFEMHRIDLTEGAVLEKGAVYVVPLMEALDLPAGITALAVDSIFMMPQLGVMANIGKKDLSEQARAAAIEVFEKDCLIRLGTCIAPVGKLSSSEIPLHINLEFKNGEKKDIEVRYGELSQIEAAYEEIKAVLTPAKGVDVGAGQGEQIITTIYGGQVGIVFDGRGRPLEIDSSSSKRILDLKKWSEAMNEYPEIGK